MSNVPIPFFSTRSWNTASALWRWYVNRFNIYKCMKDGPCLNQITWEVYRSSKINLVQKEDVIWDPTFYPLLIFVYFSHRYTKSMEDDGLTHDNPIITSSRTI